MQIFRRKWVRRIAEIAVIVALFSAVRGYQQIGLAEGHAPALSGRTLEGQRFSLTGSAGGPIMVHFWATWCSICAIEHGNIESVAEDHRVITVAMQSGNDEAVEAYLDERQLRFPVINDENGAIAARWGITTVPATLIVDDSGQIRFREVGYTTEAGLRARLWMASP